MLNSLLLRSHKPPALSSVLALCCALYSASAVALLFAAAAAALCGVWRRHMLLGPSPLIAPPAFAMLAACLSVWLACATALAAIVARR